MKKLIQSLAVLSILFSLVFLQSCRKPKPVNDPCKNPIQVTALSTDLNAYVHFSSDNGNLYAVNFSSYANQIAVGNDYQISYVEVACDDVYNRCGSIAVGGCFPQKKCIKITCLKPVTMNCMGCELNPIDFDVANACMQNVYGIYGKRLKTRVGFSDCSEEGSKNLRLKLQLLQTANASGKDVWLAKIAYPQNDVYICQAYFEKDMCFDLSDLNNYYWLRNMAPAPEEVIIRFIKGEETFDFNYTL